MDLKEYNDFVKGMKIYPDAHKITYPALGLSGEAGECAEKVKKWLRGDKELDKKELAKEAGDVLFYVAALADDIGYTLQDIVDMNVEKLTMRKKKGVIKGDGDNRGEEKKPTMTWGYVDGRKFPGHDVFPKKDTMWEEMLKAVEEHIKSLPKEEKVPYKDWLEGRYKYGGSTDALMLLKKLGFEEASTSEANSSLEDVAEVHLEPFSFGKPEPKMPEDRGALIYRELITPDGTVLVCRHRHDYKEHWDKVTFQTYMLDGFQGYYRASMNGDEVINEVYALDPIDKIREKFEWGQNYDADMNRLPDTIWIKLKDIGDSHLDGIIVYCEDTGNVYLPIFRREKEYRYRLKHGGKI